MHISPITEPISVSGAVAKTARAAHGTDAFGSGHTAVFTQIDAVKARYDMTNISAREVDQTAKDLMNAGYKDIVQIGRLLIQGEQWHLQQDVMLADATRETGVAYEIAPMDPTQKLNLVAKAEADIEYLLSIGKDTKYAKEFLGFLKSFYGKNNAIPAASTRVAAAAEAALARQNTTLN
ncbi:hypothetical protein GG681_09710 [Epibacterium sp. SM1969]|uniref:Uncharacterized protein n=1 Tax=Tritonibacter aquimaris TaxID=2663379 RepID=A0A844AM23_9RHOB|nr:hypothetical protein [Tritonibacter aquimaris]MQY42919.1 hypothetical protein [Tritonibacter aquimaris]